MGSIGLGGCYKISPLIEVPLDVTETFATGDGAILEHLRLCLVPPKYVQSPLLSEISLRIQRITRCKRSTA